MPPIHALLAGLALAISALIYHIASLQGLGRYLIPSLWVVACLAGWPFVSTAEKAILLIAGLWPLAGWIHNASVGQKE